jgi:hypothetical protein
MKKLLERVYPQMHLAIQQQCYAREDDVDGFQVAKCLLII